MEQLEDRHIKCHECGNEFLFSADEQKFYKEKGFNDPKRCRPCRKARKQRRGNRGGGNRKSSGGNRRSNREMHDAVCTDCGASTKVPFVPEPGRPVYCRDCYRNQRRS